MTELTFKSGTKHRKQYFTGLHFSHPAKMHLSLQLWLIDKYTKPGEVILDPMAGSGTILVACMMGRNVLTLELEDKFVSMQKGNWEKIRQRGPMMGYEMGQSTILQGDARDMSGILADKIISSPPYGNRLSDDVVNDDDPQRMSYRQSIDKIISSPPYEGTESRDRSKESWWDGEREKKFSGGSAKLAKGYQADTIITSPPYAETLQGSGADAARKRIAEGKYKGLRPDVWTSKGNVAGSTFGDGYSADPENLSNLPYGSIDKVITSPPYEGTIEKPLKTGTSRGLRNRKMAEVGERSKTFFEGGYSENKQNIGNLKGDTYLEAMLLVYQNCYSVLKQGGLLILVTKNFIRDKKEIRLDEDTIKLCEQAGFTFKERHYRKLTSQSFWRTIYQQKYPDAPVLNKEDILIFSKGVLA